MKVKVSDVVAKFFADNNMDHVFGIIGAGNAHIFDSVYLNKSIEMVCVHHEQAACMAMQIYYRTCGKVTASVLTTGAGSTNGITGVVSAWADSIPCLIVSGNEHSRYIHPGNNLRMYGVQGYDSSFMVSKVTKYSSRVMEAKKVLLELEKALYIAKHGRPGPCWVDIPMNIQSTFIDDSELERFNPETDFVAEEPVLRKDNLEKTVDEIIAELSAAKRPVIWLGHGIKLAGGEQLISTLMSKLPAAYLISWAGIDMIDSNHPLLFGRAGVYGQRASNFVLQNADYLVTIGTRLSISQVGYDISELARMAKITVVDIDKSELDKYPERFNRTVCADAKQFLDVFLDKLGKSQGKKFDYNDWIERCNKYKMDFPTVDKEHSDSHGFMNSYRFMKRLNEILKPDQVIVTDMGTALLSGHQVLEISPGQRLMTSTGLGEMGYGLPAAIGASFATGGGEVLCLNCDGGMMMNLQELQTIVHHNLPVKIIVFNNDGYLMIKHTQKSIAGGRYAGTNKASGVSCPDFSKVATAFNIPSWKIKTWSDFERVMPEFMNCTTAAMCEVAMDPEQFFVPKLSLAIQKDGSLLSPPLEDLFPFVRRKQMEESMIVGLHPKSRSIEDHD
jgi:acetolactate synthase-1/2/3 large subunit